MSGCEGVSTALSVLLFRFKLLPRICYYNACSMLRSIALRAPWMNDKSLIVCDKFHYKSHTCNSVSDPDSCLSCNHHKTSGAESINHLWNFSKSHVKYLSVERMPTFLAARAVFINIRTIARQASKNTDIENVNIPELARDFWTCNCQRCTK